MRMLTFNLDGLVQEKLKKTFLLIFPRMFCWQIIAIIVEAYMKVVTEVANMEAEQEFCTDVASVTLGRGPCLTDVIAKLYSCAPSSLGFILVFFFDSIDQVARAALAWTPAAHQRAQELMLLYKRQPLRHATSFSQIPHEGHHQFPVPL